MEIEDQITDEYDREFLALIMGKQNYFINIHRH